MSDDRADIFVSYARRDAKRVEPLVDALKEAASWKVIWDKDLPGGEDYERWLGHHLDTAKIVMPIWSTLSVTSDFVRSEARRANRRDALLPVTIDSVDLPLGLDHIHALDLTDWIEGREEVLPTNLLTSIRRKLIVGASASPSPSKDYGPTDASTHHRRPNVNPAKPGWIEGSIDINILLAFAFGVVFLVQMLVMAVIFPNPTPFMIRVFITVLATAAAGVGAVLPGFIEIKYKKAVRAGGAMALFAIVWFSQPVIESKVVRLEKPSVSPSAVVESFFKYLDGGDISKSYADLDKVARDMMVPTEADWRQLYEANIKGLGEVVHRKLMGTNAFESPSGYPIGIYQQFGYLTKYQNVQGCRQEFLTVRATQDLQWRVFNYNISPQSVECPPGFMSVAPSKPKE